MIALAISLLLAAVPTTRPLTARELSEMKTSMGWVADGTQAFETFALGGHAKRVGAGCGPAGCAGVIFEDNRNVAATLLPSGARVTAIAFPDIDQNGLRDAVFTATASADGGTSSLIRVLLQDRPGSFYDAMDLSRRLVDAKVQTVREAVEFAQKATRGVRHVDCAHPLELPEEFSDDGRWGLYVSWPKAVDEHAHVSVRSPVDGSTPDWWTDGIQNEVDARMQDQCSQIESEDEPGLKCEGSPFDLANETLKNAGIGDGQTFAYAHSKRYFGKQSSNGPRLDGEFYAIDPSEHSPSVSAHPDAPISIEVRRGGLTAQSVPVTYQLPLSLFRCHKREVLEFSGLFAGDQIVYVFVSSTNQQAVRMLPVRLDGKHLQSKLAR